MDKNLLLMNLEAFKGLVNGLINRQETGDDKLVEILEEHYKLSKQEIEEILEKVQKRSDVGATSNWLHISDLEKLQAFFKIAEMDGSSFDPTDPDLYKLKGAIQEKIRETIKFVKMVPEKKA